MAHAKRRKPQAKRKQSRQPASTWILLGALGGVLISSALFVKLTNENTQQTQTSTPANTSPSDGQLNQTHTEVDQPRFHFYTMLQNMQEQNQSPSSRPEARTPTLTLKQPELPQYEYHVQVGSFSKKDDANKLKAQLILDGYNVQLDQVKVKQVLWYRVQIGPFTSQQIAQQKQKELEEQKIHGTLVLKKGIG